MLDNSTVVHDIHVPALDYTKPPTSYFIPPTFFYFSFAAKRQKKRPSQSHSLRRAEYQLAVPLKLRPRTPLCGFVFQTPGNLRGLTEDDYSRPRSGAGTLSRPWFGVGFTASARKGWAFGNRSPPVFSCPGSLDAAFPRRLRHRLCYEITASVSPVRPFVKRDLRKTAEEHQ